MRPVQLISCALVWSAILTSPAWAQAAGRPETLTDKFPWLGEFVAAILGIALLCLMIYLFRPGAAAASADFSIEVDAGEVTFKGRFPPALEATVENFLLHDCQIPGPYKVLGQWNDNRLAITVRGENAKPLEQRIRNFLKLNIKKPA